MNQQLQHDPQIPAMPDLPPRRIAFLQAGWHGEIVEQCRLAFEARIADFGIPRDAIDLIEVPGGYEIPLQAKLLAKSGAYDAIAASALIVDGGIYRHDFVANAVINGMMTVQLETEVPVLSAVLTPHHFHEHAIHKDFFFAHFRTKGTELAEACARAIDLRRKALTAAAAE